MAAEIKVKKKTVYLFIAVIVILLIAVYLSFYYIPEVTQANKIKAYKTAMFESLVCQYSCPVIEQIIGNSTILAPQVQCIQNCTQELRAKGYNENEFSNEDLLTDNLLQDTIGVIDSCREINKDNLGSTNYTIFFPCALQGLTEIRANYTYLD